MPRCEAAAIPRCGRWATARRFRGRTAVPTPRLPSMRSVKRDTSRDNIGAVHRRASSDRRSCSASLGTMASLGHTRAVARVFGLRAHGLPRLVAAPDLLPLSDAALGPAAADCPRLDRRSLLQAGHHAGRLARGTRAGDAGAPAGGLAEPLARRRVDQQQEAEAEGGEQAGEARTVVEGFGNHRFRRHRQQGSGPECLQPRRPRLAERADPDVPCRDRCRSLRWRSQSRAGRCRGSCGRPRACLRCSIARRARCRPRTRSPARGGRQDPAARFPAPSPRGRRRARCRARWPRRCHGCCDSAGC